MSDVRTWLVAVGRPRSVEMFIRTEAAEAFDQFPGATISDRMLAAASQYGALLACVREVAAMPDVQRNPDGVDQAAATMKLIAAETLALVQDEGSL